jgi:hypothetical protein
MFYFLLSNSSITKIKDPEKKLLTTFLYGSVLYIIFHAILNTSNKSFFKIIKTYYWTLLALDIFTLIFYYKSTFINLIIKDGIVKKIITMVGNLLRTSLNKLVDTSSYSTNIDFSSNVGNTDSFEDVKCTLNNLKQKTLELENFQEHQSTLQPQPILKKVSFNEKENISHTISNDIKELNNDLQNLNHPTNINSNINQINNCNGYNDNSNNDNINSNNINSNNNNSNYINSNNNNSNNCSNSNYNNSNNSNNNNINSNSRQIDNTTSSSIQEIRKKQNIDISNLQQYDNNTLLLNREELSNDELENIKLNYNPNDLLNNIKYETEQNNELLNGNNFMSGNSNTKLDNNDIGTIKSTIISKNNNLINYSNNDTSNNTSKTNSSKNNTDNDKISVISSVSDLGSILDFNLDEFEKELN